MTAARPLPADLRGRVLDAARAVRTPGAAVPAPEVVPAPEALRRAADRFGVLLQSLEPEQWRIRVLRELDVQGLVGHLIGVERDVAAALRGDPAAARADHVASTQSDAEGQAGRPPEQTLAEWQARVTANLDDVEEQRGRGTVVALHGMHLPVDDLLVVRAFELWTHENDVRAALALPPSVPDGATLALMTRLAVRLLPHGAVRAGRPRRAVALHLVLLGSGGGTWDVPMNGGDAAGDAADLVVVVDAVDFCRVVADRLDPAALDLHVLGDRADVDGVLAAAAALALD